MIVRQFLHWLRTAPPDERAEATSALARAYLYSELSDNDRAAAEGAMIMLLDDPSPLVRRALSEAFASSEGAPPTIVHALATDQPDVACPLLERSPLFLDTDLIDAVASGEPARQVAVAGRAYVPPPRCRSNRRSRMRRGLPARSGKFQCGIGSVFARSYRCPSWAPCSGP